MKKENGIKFFPEKLNPISYSGSEFMQVALPEEDGSGYLPFGSSLEDIRKSCEENKL